MGRADYLEIGTWNALCDRCQRKYKANQLKLEWTGWRVCESCWEPRHPQEFLRGHREDENVDWSRPDSDSGCVAGPSNIAGHAIAGCALAGWFLKYTNPL